MKTNFIILIGATTLVSLTSPLLADPSSADETLQRDRDLAHSQGARLGELRRADRIIGSEVRDNQGEKSGKVKDLALDLMNGRIVEVIVATGGILGLDRELVAMPPSSFTLDPATKELRMNVNRKQLKSDPEFSVSHWGQSTDIAQINEVYRRYGVEPYFKGDQTPAVKSDDTNGHHGQDSRSYSFNGDNALPHLGHIASASKLLGASARSMGDEKLGRVEDFLVDLPAGRVVEVVLGLGGVVHPGGELTAVPPQAFHWNADKTELTLDTTRPNLEAAPHFKADEWAWAGEPAHIREDYALYHISPYFVMREVDNGAQNVRERTDTTTSLDKTNNSDLKLTEDIRKAVMAHENLAVDAREFKIIVVSGTVSLIGTVANENEKQQIGELAAKFVPADKVDNLLQVRGAPTTPVLPSTDTH